MENPRRRWVTTFVGGLRLSPWPLSSSFWGLPFRILNINHKKVLLRGLWVGAYACALSPVLLGRFGVRAGG